MDPGLIWILFGLALLGVELAIPGIYMVWVGAAAIGTGLVQLFVAPLGFPLSVGLFLALMAAGIATSLTFRKRGGPAHRVNAPEAGLAGRHAMLLAVEGTTLRVRVGDSEWPARMPRGVAPPEPGTALRVEAVDGMVLVVRPEPAPGA